MSTTSYSGLTWCSVKRCENFTHDGSDFCIDHQNLGRGEQHDPFDPEVTRLRQKLARIGELVERCFRTDPYNTYATLRAIREELAR